MYAGRVYTEAFPLMIITGIDIGSSRIKGLVAEEKRDGAVTVLTAFSQPSTGFRRGVLVDVEEATSVLRDLAVDLSKISRKALQHVYVNINSEHVRARMSRGIVAVARADQEIQQEDIDRVFQASNAVKLADNRMVLHNIVREYFVDDIGDITEPLGMTGNRLEASTVIIEAFAPHVSVLTRNMERVGFGAHGPVFNPLATSQAVLSKRQRELGALSIDFGSGTTSLAVYEEGKLLHAKSFPMGVGYVTNDIAIGLKTSIDVAEKLKTTYGYAIARDVPRRDVIQLSEVDSSLTGELSKKFLAEIIEERLVEILGLVNAELKTIGRPLHLPGGAVITGGGVKLAGMAELVRQELKLPVQIGFPSLKMFEIPNASHQETIDDPSFATAVGLVLLGFADTGTTRPTRSHGNRIVEFLKNLMP